MPSSFFEAAAKNEVLQVVFFSVLFAVGLTRSAGRPKEAMLAFCEGLSEVMFKFTGHRHEVRAARHRRGDRAPSGRTGSA